jgi:serine/threonine-protein kinase
MDAERWQLIESLVEGALAVPAGEARAAWLAANCRGDESVRAEVASLVAVDEEAEGFLAEPLIARVAHLLDSEEGLSRVGQQIGQYRLLREIGRGGMGVVYLAERGDGEFRQRAAVKLIRRGLDTEDILRRFRNERQILASLNHPNIARLFDGGTTPDGSPYFAMEYVEGEPLADYCDRRGLSTHERLRLFQTVCSAVSHAHRNLVVHRDLKPSNVLVNDAGEPKLLDFGVAMFLNPELVGAARTRTRYRVLTPEYASPEQVRGELVTTATDIYSLGVILYELLTGARPYRVKDTSPDGLARAICNTEPTRPSQAAADSGRAAGSSRGKSSRSPQSAARNAKSLRGDLDNIVLTALRKEPQRRYKSVDQFSEDIRLHLGGRPVLARKDTFSYRASKFVSRHKVGVAATALVVLATVAGLFGTAWQARVARAERDRARVEQAKAERIGAFLSAALAYSDPSAAAPGTKNRRDATVGEMLDEFAPRIEAALPDEPEARASLQRTVGFAYISQNRFAEAERYLDAALQTQLKIYGEHHQEVALTLTGLGTARGLAGDLARSEENLRQAVAIYRDQSPRDQTHLKAFATALDELGSSTWTKGDYQATESAYTESLAVASRLQGDDREPLADAELGLGITRYAQGRLDEATDLLRRSLDEYRRLPHTRWKWSNALNFLAQSLIWKNQFDEALDDLRESDRISREIWGDNNPFYARSLWLRVYALCFKGDCAAAEEPLNRAEEIYRRVSPDNSAIMANVADARNLFLTRTGRPGEGEPFGRKAVELYQSTMSHGAPSVTLARINLAESLEAQKKFDAAEQVLLEAHRDAGEMQGAQHWRTKAAARALVKLYEAWGKPDLALKYRDAAR